MLKCDLHLHTNRSDGSLSPLSLMDCLRVSSLDICAVTDHDTIDGVIELFNTPKKYPFKLLTGVEFSTFDGDEIHILGYNYDYKNKELIEYINELKLIRKKRNEIIINKLKNLGINIPFYDVCKDENKQYGRKIIAKMMTERGFVNSTEEAFDVYLGQEKLAYAPYNHTTPKEAIEHIIKADGVAVLAHPYRSASAENVEDLIKELAEYGLKGVEVYYPHLKKNETDYLLKICGRYDLIATGGSDFHNPDDPLVSIGSANAVLDEKACKVLRV